MIAFKLAIRNLLGARLRTSLIVFILSLSYFLIIFMNGMYQGWDKQARYEMIRWEVAQGQYWQENYDPYDPFTLTDAHAAVPDIIKNDIEKGNAAAILISQATIYPGGRIQSALMRGIDPEQQVLSLPTEFLKQDSNEIPVLIGRIMANNTKLEVGDDLLIRWRDVNGTFDATEVRIAGMFDAAVPAIDMGQIWVPLDKMQEMTGMEGEATIIIKGEGSELPAEIDGWIFRDHDYLFTELEAMIQTKSIGGSIFYLLFLALALLAIFDTQVLSIFRRQREIGTCISMGMTRRQVIGLFTVEGAMHAVLALIVGAIYGIPVMILVASRGIAMPEGTESFGLAAAQRIMPAYSAALILGSIILVLITTTIVSYFPSRKIAKMNPNDAIRGKIQH